MASDSCGRKQLAPEFSGMTCSHFRRPATIIFDILSDGHEYSVLE